MHTKLKLVLGFAPTFISILTSPTLAGAEDLNRSPHRLAALTNTGATAISHRTLQEQTPLLDSSKNSPPPLVLNGKLEQIDQLDQLEGNIDVPAQKQASLDARFDSSRLSSQANNGQLAGAVQKVWYKIPSWITGTWQTTDKRLIGAVDYQTGRQTGPKNMDFGYCGETFGFQQDRNGNFWQYAKIGVGPSNMKADKNGRVQFNLVDAHDLVSSNDTQLIVKKRWRHVVMNNDTKEIISIKPFESIITFDRSGDNNITIDEKIIGRDNQGRVANQKEVVTAKQRIAGYQEIDQRQGDDLRGSFASYLETHGLNNTIAKAAATPASFSHKPSNAAARKTAAPAAPGPALFAVPKQKQPGQIKFPVRTAELTSKNEKFEIDIDIDLNHL
jgi:hypothetical protein